MWNEKTEKFHFSFNREDKIRFSKGDWRWRIWENYLKKYRVSRGLTLWDVAKAGVSTSQLSRFEQGKTDLTITRLALVLEEMNMPIAEFMHVAGDFQRNHWERLLERIHYYHSVQDVAG